jgi:uncharacterized protein
MRSAAPIPDLAALVARVESTDTNAGSHLHGPAHWRCVAEVGLRLCDQTPGADRVVVFLFGLLHDSRREDDGRDIDHGRRAAKFVLELQADGMLALPDETLRKLHNACAGHVDQKQNGDPTIGTCWDADRLNLCRLSIEVRPEFLSTSAAREPAMIRSAEALAGQRMTWAETVASGTRGSHVGATLASP